MVHLTMMKVRLVILQFLFLILIRKYANGENSMGIISKLLRHYRNPVIVMINNNNNIASDTKDVLRMPKVHRTVKGGKSKVLKHIKDNKKSAGLINDIIRSTGDKKKPIVKKTQAKFEKAIRTQCQTFDQCETKCTNPDAKKNGCMSLCQKLFDELDLCNKDKKVVEINVSTRGPPHSVEESHSCESNNECNESKDPCDDPKDDCGKPKDDCDESDDCKSKDECDESDDNCKPKNECDESDDKCKPKDECEESDDNCNR